MFPFHIVVHHAKGLLETNVQGGHILSGRRLRRIYKDGEGNLTYVLL